MDERPRPRRQLGRYAFIGFFILLIFTAVLYALGGFPGNDTDQVPAGTDTSAAPTATQVASAGQCAARPDLAAAIEDARIGNVAGVAPTDPQDLSALAFNGPDGEAMTLADFEGRTVLLNLWATWCGPCREEMPALDAMERQMGGEDFEVVAVNLDRGGMDAGPRDFLGEVGVTALGAYSDPTNALFNDMKSRGLALGLPVTAIIDPEGCLRAALNGPADWASPEAAALVDVVREG